MLLLLLLLFPLAYSRMYCGLDPMTNFLMEVQVKLDCRPIFPTTRRKTEYERVEFQTKGIAGCVQVHNDNRPYESPSYSKISAAHNECCMEHGFCYLRRQPYEECDNTYCSCIAPLSTEGVCKFHAENYCNNVKANGKNIYPMFTMENGK